VVADADRKRIAGLQLVRRFRPRVIQLHLARSDRLLREAAGLEEPRRPEPLIQPQW
jgi:hypothetical protein